MADQVSTRRPSSTGPTSPTRPAGEPRPAARFEQSTTSSAEVSPDISTFSGVVGAALIGFAIVRIILTLLGDQPAVPARFDGTEASLLRIGESFGSAGSAWPLALAFGTILLTLPTYLGIPSHLRRWAPMVGLAAATGIVSIVIGFLRFSAGRRLESASTVKLLSDVIVGPVGFGALTLLAIALAVRSRRA